MSLTYSWILTISVGKSLMDLYNAGQRHNNIFSCVADAPNAFFECQRVEVIGYQVVVAAQLSQIDRREAKESSNYHACIHKAIVNVDNSL